MEDLTILQRAEAGPQQEEKEAVLTQGWLLKRGKVNKAFKRRWFKFADGHLIYQVQPGAPPRGRIPLTSIECVTVSPDAPPQLYVKVPDRIFIIRSPDDTLWTLQAWQRSIDSSRKAATQQQQL